MTTAVQFSTDDPHSMILSFFSFCSFAHCKSRNKILFCLFQLMPRDNTNENQETVNLTLELFPTARPLVSVLL